MTLTTNDSYAKGALVLGLSSETARDHEELVGARHPTGLGLHEVRTLLPGCWLGSDIPSPVSGISGP